MGNESFFGLSGIQILEGTYVSYLGKFLKNLTNKIKSFRRLKNFRRFRVFVLSYTANSKRRKRRKNADLFKCSVVFETVETIMFFVWKTPLDWFYIT